MVFSRHECITSVVYLITIRDAVCNEYIAWSGRHECITSAVQFISIHGAVCTKLVTRDDVSGGQRINSEEVLFVRTRV